MHGWSARVNNSLAPLICDFGDKPHEYRVLSLITEKIHSLVPARCASEQISFAVIMNRASLRKFVSQSRASNLHGGSILHIYLCACA